MRCNVCSLSENLTNNFLLFCYTAISSMETLSPHSAWVSIQYKDNSVNICSLKPFDSLGSRIFPNADGDWHNKRVWNISCSKSEHHSTRKEKILSFPRFKIRLCFCCGLSTDNWWWVVYHGLTRDFLNFVRKVQKRQIDACVKIGCYCSLVCSKYETPQKEANVCYQIQIFRVLLREPGSNNLALKNWRAKLAFPLIV